MAVLGLRFCARALSSCGERGPLFIAVRGPLTIAASLVAEHRLQTCRLSSCGSRAQLLHGMWDPPRRGLEPVFPALAGRVPTTAPPGKSSSYCLMCSFTVSVVQGVLQPHPQFWDFHSGVLFTDICSLVFLWEEWSQEQPMSLSWLIICILSSTSLAFSCLNCKNHISYFHEIILDVSRQHL